MKQSLYLFWWKHFNKIKEDLFIYLTDNGMHFEFAFKKVNKMTRGECAKYLNELQQHSAAYKKGYDDGDYWNGPQNPYSYEYSINNYKDYEKGFEQCKQDKKQRMFESIVKEQLDKHK